METEKEIREVRQQAKVQLTSFLKKNYNTLRGVVVCSKGQYNLLYVEFPKDSIIKDSKIEELNLEFNKSLNRSGLEVEVRKNWF